ncbi:MAG: branched-chain amino acid transaminase [Pseudomonadota bacterium]
MSSDSTQPSIWKNGQLVPFAEATCHVLCHALHYGSSVFEGIRLYGTPEGPRFFRLNDHMQRMYDSAKIYRMKIPYDLQTLLDATHEVVATNGLQEGAYIRPFAFRGMSGLGVAPPEDGPIDVCIAAQKWGAYLGADGLERGVDVCVSSWQRVAPNTIPATAKAAGNYLSSQLITMEAQRLGFVEGIGLTVDGTVSEGAGENLFLVRQGRIVTPPTAASILGGITRDTIIHLAKDLGYEVVEQAIPREMLYLADELFFTGTAAEVTPIRSVDHIEIGPGHRGPVTKKIQDAFFGLFSGKTADTRNWLEPLGEAPTSAAAAAGA